MCEAVMINDQTFFTLVPPGDPGSLRCCWQVFFFKSPAPPLDAAPTRPPTHPPTTFESVFMWRRLDSSSVKKPVRAGAD